MTLAHGEYPADTDYFFFRPPGYPAFIAAVTLGHPRWIPILKIANAALHGASAALAASLAWRLWRRRAISLAAGLWTAFHPPFLYLVSDVQSEPLFVFLLLAGALLLLVGAERPSSGLALLGGACWALAALTRASGLFLLPLFAAYLFDRRHPARVRRALAASALLGFCATIAPWTIRNARAYGAFMPVNNAGGFVFYLGNSTWMAHFYQLRSADEYRRWQNELNDAVMNRWRSEIPGLDTHQPAEVSQALRQAAWRWIQEHPADQLRLLWRKTLDWLRPWASPLVHGKPLAALSGIYYSALFLLGAAGLARAPNRGPALAALALLAISMAGHVALIAQLRYRMAFWDPVLLIYAPWGAAAILGRFMRDRTTEGFAAKEPPAGQ